MSKLRVFCRRPAQNFPYGLTFLVEDPQPEEEIASATGVFVQYGNDPMQEALLKTYQDYRGTGVGTTLAHARNIKIEIMTITGRIVREITKEELGSLHIGRNITDFKWDGTDQYGQKLANGIYLYRVVTNLNGKSLDKYKAEGDNTDKYFNKGYGKMYLMR